MTKVDQRGVGGKVETPLYCKVTFYPYFFITSPGVSDFSCTLKSFSLFSHVVSVLLKYTFRLSTAHTTRSV